MAKTLVKKVSVVLVFATMLGVVVTEGAMTSTAAATPEVTYATPPAPLPILGDEWAPTQTRPGQPY